MTSTTMTIRLESETKIRLDKLAEITHRSKSYLASEAINEYLNIQEWQLTEIKKGLAEANEGQLEDHENILALWENKKK
ncbi:CopG family ribbon-helix-helix protein [Legionella pneumophila serogroup 1]|uniref:CopG family ribbon-helix-helix protein n=1 Tax=Legionella pneumophila TaxID=446 RepID=UPI0007786B4F|nr:CopG family ribbon-helix-helix protein [Legionella pneumophila]HAT8623611.1 ribbon-helix-helix protein, CopG family [Legionella pneumophila]HAU1410275.1 ribbon-helix-helix protein, CopG family [Legionella pneumophila]HCC3170255.1 CopG family ribbon-helix-helix protein [Legionella pneumophila]HCC3179485.1 CopG family ribbon-helix-helix protein [Legionella pneumophila]HCC3185435.1 CopG family ribbon-helix-helix protein [Legionella pneumophila]